MARLLTHVNIRYFKSISACSVPLSDLTVFVGPNGVGKSNFVDALSFVADAMNSTVDYAIRQRGGIAAVRKRSGGHPTHFAISLGLSLPSGSNANYSFQVAAKKDGAFIIQREMAQVELNAMNFVSFAYENGVNVQSSTEIGAPPRISEDRLALQLMSSYAPFREVADFLAGMRFYNIHPQDFRYPQPHDYSDSLQRTGKNIASAIKILEESDKLNFERVKEYISRLVDNIYGLNYRQLGPTETIEFSQKVRGQKHPWKFFPAQMSDGTLRSLGILVALFQHTTNPSVGAIMSIEEPESTIHPAASAIIMDALLEVSRRRQIIITTHSPELLDHPNVDIDDIRVVSSSDSDTRIFPADNASVTAVKKALFTPGELLRSNQIQPDTKQKQYEQFRFSGF